MPGTYIAKRKRKLYRFTLHMGSEYVSMKRIRKRTFKERKQIT